MSLCTSCEFAFDGLRDDGTTETICPACVAESIFEIRETHDTARQLVIVAVYCDGHLVRSHSANEHSPSVVARTIDDARRLVAGLKAGTLTVCGDGCGEVCYEGVPCGCSADRGAR